jgi:hypothetical protein
VLGHEIFDWSKQRLSQAQSKVCTLRNLAVRVDVVMARNALCDLPGELNVYESYLTMKIFTKTGLRVGY